MECTIDCLVGFDNHWVQGDEFGEGHLYSKDGKILKGVMKNCQFTGEGHVVDEYGVV